MEQIDILLATYNGEKYIEEQLDSILSQTYSNFRLIISDDYSEDGTRRILEEYEKKDERIKVFYQEKNLGYVKNFEFLLTKVENEIYALADQDDIWLPEKIEKTIVNMQSNNSDLCFTDLILIDENGNEISKSFWKEKSFDSKIKKDKEYKGLLLNNYITGCTIVSKKEFIKYILPIPKDSKYLIHDYWIPIVISQKGKISYMREPYIKYRQHGNNQVGYKTKSKELKTLKEIRNLFIEVKIEHFNIFVENNKLFKEEIQIQNKKALNYYLKLKNIKNVNFKNWYLFYKLYKYENFSYFLGNFVILNIPILAKCIFKIIKR